VVEGKPDREDFAALNREQRTNFYQLIDELEDSLSEA